MEQRPQTRSANGQLTRGWSRKTILRLGASRSKPVGAHCSRVSTPRAQYTPRSPTPANLRPTSWGGWVVRPAKSLGMRFDAGLPGRIGLAAGHERQAGGAIFSAGAAVPIANYG